MREGMRFVFPTLTYKDKAIEYINEFYEYGSEIDGSGADVCDKPMNIIWLIGAMKERTDI